MSGMEPMLLGAALGGGTSALMGKNPIQGALLGGLGGGVYGMAGNAANVANAAAAGESVIPYAAAEKVLAAPTFGQTMSALPGALKQGIRENPMYAMQGLNSAQGLLTPEPMPQAPMGQVQRGQPVAPVDFASLLNPQQYKPQPISLLG
jgi:hypothetical protein